MVLSSSLPPIVASSVSGLLASSYVGILYILSSARSKPWEKDPITGQPRDRQHPAVIRARLLGACLVTCFSLFVIGCLIKLYGSADSQSVHLIRATAQLTGFLPNPTEATLFDSIRLLIQPLALTCVLFLGPLYSLLIIETSNHTDGFTFQDLLNLQTLRNLIIAPITEEIVFRGCIIATSLLIEAGLRPSATRIIFLSPLWFGAAHIHSIRELYLSNGHNLLAAFAVALFQFIYTTVFGWYASFVYLRTGSVIAASLCHTFCNFMGFPPIVDSFKHFPNHKLSIAASYILGIAFFSWGVKSWATDPTSFPTSTLFWWDLK